MNYHKVTKQIIELIEQNNFWYEKFEHEPVRTSEEAAKLRVGYDISQGTKALIIKLKLKTGVTEFIMAVVNGDKRFSSAKLKKLTNSKDCAFASEEEVLKLTGGIAPGGVPPFGNLFGISVYMDKGIFEMEKIIFNAGDKSVSIGMYSKDLLKVVSPVVCELV